LVTAKQVSISGAWLSLLYASSNKCIKLTCHTVMACDIEFVPLKYIVSKQKSNWNKYVTVIKMPFDN